MGNLTVNKTMQCLNISRQSAMAWLASGKFPNAKKDNDTGWWLIPADEVEEMRLKIIKKHEKKIQKVSTPAVDFLNDGEDA